MNCSRSAISSTVVLLIAFCALPAWSEAEPDLSSPDACLRAVLSALETGDGPALTWACVGNKSQRNWIAAKAAQTRALRQLEQSLSDHFGATWADTRGGKRIASRLDELRDDSLDNDLKQATQKSGADGAVLLVVREGDPDELQPRIVQSEGQWKLDLGSLTDYIGPGDARLMRSIAQSASKLSKAVGMGDFSSLEDAGGTIAKQLATAADPQPATRPAVKSE